MDLERRLDSTIANHQKNPRAEAARKP
ncbi:unnamed protein product [Ectocarpus sp. CCAP 1310/34]|nr:unnamed protein product [Ectocarpus sp. CCAP 1310/34]